MNPIGTSCPLAIAHLLPPGPKKVTRCRGPQDLKQLTNPRLQDLPFKAIFISLQHGAAHSYEQSPILNNAPRAVFEKR